MLGLSLSLGWDVALGMSEAVALVYLHLPQLLSETLFLRFVLVLENHFEHLLGHIACCFVHKMAYRCVFPLFCSLFSAEIGKTAALPIWIIL